MEVLRRGVARRQSLTGKCPICRCVVRLSESRDRGLVQRDREGIPLVKCPTEGCPGWIVVECGWV